MRRLTIAASVCTLTAALGAATAESATAAAPAEARTHQLLPRAGALGALRADTSRAAQVRSVVALRSFSMSDRFAREKVVVGDQDLSPTHINHVIELQTRLRWAGVYSGGITGYFGERTQAAVRTYQRHHHLAVSGQATHATWAKLINSTIQGRKAVPSTCKRSGWHACYDRSRHQVTLWKSGRLHNSWLVRGGATQYKTRPGTHKVYLRSRYHVSHLYHTPMPYAQFFSGGQAFHASYYMTRPFVGHSHGCVNMYVKDARQLWNLTAHSTLYASVYGAWA